MSAQIQPSAGDGGGDENARPERRRRSSLGHALVKLASTVGGGRGSDSEDEGEATPLALPPTDPRAASDALMGVMDVAASFRDDGMAGAAVQAWMVRVWCRLSHDDMTYHPCMMT